MSLAARTREAVQERPFLHDALRAGIVNYSAAARQLPIDGDEDAVATALRRYAEELPDHDPEQADVRVRMNGGMEWQSGFDTDALLAVDDLSLAAGSGRTAIIATGSVPIISLSTVLERLHIEGIDVDGAGATEACLVVTVPRSEGANALRIVEATLS